ncbi:MAG: TraB/GumN family protein [Oligoflexia bacterium]|nr:TraB/GumN family protein [Oligoflexia bacterium]
MNRWLILFLNFLFSAKVASTQLDPFIWTAEKEGKTSYILGTAHTGISLKEIPCSDAVSKKIQNSDLLLLETKTKNDFEKLSEEEKQKLFIGSVKEQEEIMSKLSQKTQDTIKERKIIMTHIIKDMFSHHYESAGNEAWAELSLESQNFLTNHGADKEESYANLIYFINCIAYYKAYYSLPSLDKQVKQMALSHFVKIESMDHNKKINEDFSSKTSSNKPRMLVSRSDVEGAIKEIESLTGLYQQIFLNTARLYQLYDANAFLFNHNLDETILLKNRNELWLKNFLKTHEKYENIFITASLKHFIGEHNMLDMLKGEGFSVERMTCSNTEPF